MDYSKELGAMQKHFGITTEDEFIKQAAISALPAVITNFGNDGNHTNRDIVDEAIVLAELLAKRFVFEEK